MIRALPAGLLVLAGLAAFAPHAQAVYICQVLTDPTDLQVGDDPYVTARCSTENLINYTCKAEVRLNQDLSVYRATSCEPIICTTYCDPPIPDRP
jgi:hypothetical protein